MLATFAPVGKTGHGGVMGMDGQPDVVSFEPGRRRRGRRPAAGRGGRIAVTVVLLACLSAIASLALLVAGRDHTITSLRAALRGARHQAPAVAAGPALTPPAGAGGSAMFTLPDARLGSFSVVAVAIRASPGSAPVAWLFVYGQHADPGQRYGLLEGTCGGQYVTASDLADGVADGQGNLTITAQDPAIRPQAPGVWVILYRWEDGAPLGGVQGPLAGRQAKTFRSAPPC
jgi:hypothetical protein